MNYMKGFVLIVLVVCVGTLVFIATSGRSNNHVTEMVISPAFSSVNVSNKVLWLCVICLSMDMCLVLNMNKLSSFKVQIYINGPNKHETSNFCFCLQWYMLGSPDFNMYSMYDPCMNRSVLLVQSTVCMCVFDMK